MAIFNGSDKILSTYTVNAEQCEMHSNRALVLIYAFLSFYEQKTCPVLDAS